MAVKRAKKKRMTGKVWRLNALFYWSRRAWQKKKTLDTLRVTFVYTNLTTPYKIHCTFRKKNSLHVTLVYTNLTTRSKIQYTFKKKKVHTNLQSGGKRTQNTLHDTILWRTRTWLPTLKFSTLSTKKTYIQTCNRGWKNVWCIPRS